MTCYIVTFEVSDISRKSQLKEKLKQYDMYCPIHDNCWAIVTDQTAVQVREFVDAVLNSADRIFVIRSGSEAAWRNTYGDQNSNWLKKHL